MGLFVKCPQCRCCSLQDNNDAPSNETLLVKFIPISKHDLHLIERSVFQSTPSFFFFSSYFILLFFTLCLTMLQTMFNFYIFCVVNGVPLILAIRCPTIFRFSLGRERGHDGRYGSYGCRHLHICH
jgi:hypothetical protein